MDQTIAFLSSDSRDLYKADIFRSLALPNKATVVFRYDFKYLHPDIISNLSSLVDSCAVIFFLVGNKLSESLQPSMLSSISIRKAVIKSVDKSEKTKKVSFVLELGDFIECSIRSEKRDYFVYNVAVEENTNNAWIDRVCEVEKYFPKTLFFNYDIYKKDGSKIIPSYNSGNCSYNYLLDDESEYILKCSYYDMLNGISYLNYKSTNDCVKINSFDYEGIGAKIDDRRYDICTSTITRSSVSEDLILTNSTKEDELKTSIPIHFIIKKKSMTAILFAVYSMLAFIAIALVQVFTTLISMCNPPVILLIIIGIVAAGLLYFSSLKLYKQFNKK